jgi:hypothetical protein
MHKQLYTNAGNRHSQPWRDICWLFRNLWHHSHSSFDYMGSHCGSAVKWWKWENKQNWEDPSSLPTPGNLLKKVLFTFVPTYLCVGSTLYWPVLNSRTVTTYYVQVVLWLWLYLEQQKLCKAQIVKSCEGWADSWQTEKKVDGSNLTVEGGNTVRVLRSGLPAYLGTNMHTYV